MKRIEEEEKENNERWLLTYSDLITLLMIFFVIMYAMSSINSEKYNSLSKSLNAVLGSGGENVVTSGQSSIIDFGHSGGTSESENNSAAQTQISPDIGMSNVEDELNDYLAQNGLNDYAEVYTDERGVGIRFKDSVLFDSGKADVKDSLKGTIARIGSILSKDDNYIRVEGHTDNIPINNSQFKSNWQLSAVRAANVAQLLIEESGISPQKISAVGYGEYRPIADNSTAEGRSKNRRVDIVLINSKFNAVESNQ